MNSVYLISGARTSLGAYLGNLSTVPAPKLAGFAIAQAVAKAGIAPTDIKQGWMGQVIQAGVGQAPARQALLSAGLSEHAAAVTVNKVCGSGLEAIISAARSISLGELDIAVAGGMENMSLAPHLIPQARSGVGFGQAPLRDSMQWDGLWDPYSNQAMGSCAEECLKEKKLTRIEQDEYAIESFKRAQAAQKAGYFEQEIAPVKITSKKGETIVALDESPQKADFAKIPTLKPVFNPAGSITAANASSINDGAAAVVLGNQKFAKKGTFKILAYATHAANPTWFTTAPITAIQRSLEIAKIKIDQVDLFEINEAFATVPLYAMQDLKIPHAKVNPFGGAIALGHPIGCSGARIVVTLMHGLERAGGKYGVAALCIGGGEGLAIVIERVA